MLMPLILELLALVGIAVEVAAILWRSNSSPRGRRSLALISLSGAGLLVGAAASLNAMVYLNTPGASAAAAFGTRTALQARAGAWLDRHGAEAPEKTEVGRNLRILQEGLPFLRPYRAQLPADLQLRLEEASRLPTKITRILSATEERQYYEGAQAVFDSARVLANRSTGGK